MSACIARTFLQPSALSRRTLILGAAAIAVPAPAAADDMNAQQERFASGGRWISVEVFAPASDGRRPGIVMLHGADGLSSNRQYRSGAAAIAAAGYPVFLVHYLD